MVSSAITRLYDRVKRAAERGKAIQLTADEVDWLVVSGAYAALVDAAVKELFNASVTRLEAKGHNLDGLLGPDRGMPVPESD